MTKSEKRPGFAFQGLVAAIERAISQTDGVTIESPAFLLDQGGERREHDILIRRKIGLHNIVTAVECKDKSRPLGLPDLEAFARKCDRTGVDHRVLVSSNGFRKSALRASAAERIQCLTLKEAQNISWVDPAFVFVEAKRTFGPVHVHVEAPGTPGLKLEPPFGFFNSESGEELTTRHFLVELEKLADETEEPPLMRATATSPLRLEYKGPVHAIDSLGQRVDATKVIVSCDMTVIETPRPVFTGRYGDDAEGREILSVELSEEFAGNLMMVKEDDDTIRYALVPRK